MYRHSIRPSRIVRRYYSSHAEVLCKINEIWAGARLLPAVYLLLRKPKAPGGRDWRAGRWIISDRESGARGRRARVAPQSRSCRGVTPYAEAWWRRIVLWRQAHPSAGVGRIRRQVPVYLATRSVPKQVRPHEMTAAAREALQDCKIALEEFVDGVQGRQWWLRWITCVVLLRAVGHVLRNVDGRRDAKLRLAVDNWWSTLNQSKLSPPIFWSLIEEERNAILKEYRTRAGQGVTVHLGGIEVKIGRAHV